MSGTPNSITQGTPLRRADKVAIRKQVVRLAEQTGARTYQFAWDGDQKVQITGWPDGKATIEPTDAAGISLEPRKLLTRLGVPARWLGVATAAVLVLAEVVRVVAS